MANEAHLAQLKHGVEAWNWWREAHRDILPDLSGASLREADLAGADLSGAFLAEANLVQANLSGASLREADLAGADLSGALLTEANLTEANLREAFLNAAFLNGAKLMAADLSGATLTAVNLTEANLIRADLSGANLSRAYLTRAYLTRADLTRADLSGAELREATLSGATLSGADLSGANLTKAFLAAANLTGANLEGACLVQTTFEGANLTGCRIYGISAWNISLTGAWQADLVITPADEPVITVDNLEVAQFIYLLLHNEEIRKVIDTIGKKGVLILGRFAGERKAVLDTLRTALRDRGFLPMVFDFEKPTQRDFTETIMTLAGMSLFVIADITNPRSTPLELQAAVPDYMIPFVPIIAEGEPPFAMFVDLQIKYDWVLDVLTYDSIDNLLAGLQDAVIAPALQKHEALVQRRARTVGTRHIQQYVPRGNAPS